MSTPVPAIKDFIKIIDSISKAPESDLTDAERSSLQRIFDQFKNSSFLGEGAKAFRDFKCKLFECSRDDVRDFSLVFFKSQLLQESYRVLSYRCSIGEVESICELAVRLPLHRLDLSMLILYIEEQPKEQRGGFVSDLQDLLEEYSDEDGGSLVHFLTEVYQGGLRERLPDFKAVVRALDSTKSKAVSCLLHFFLRGIDLDLKSLQRVAERFGCVDKFMSCLGSLKELSEIECLSLPLIVDIFLQITSEETEDVDVRFLIQFAGQILRQNPSIDERSSFIRSFIEIRSSWPGNLCDFLRVFNYFSLGSFNCEQSYALGKYIKCSAKFTSDPEKQEGIIKDLLVFKELYSLDDSWLRLDESSLISRALAIYQRCSNLEVSDILDVLQDSPEDPTAVIFALLPCCDDATLHKFAEIKTKVSTNLKFLELHLNAVFRSFPPDEARVLLTDLLVYLEDKPIEELDLSLTRFKEVYSKVNDLKLTFDILKSPSLNSLKAIEILYSGCSAREAKLITEELKQIHEDNLTEMLSAIFSIMKEGFSKERRLSILKELQKIRPSQLPELFEKLPFIYSTLNEEEIQRFTLNLLIRFISSVSIEDVESSLIFLKELDSVFFEFSLDAHQIIIQKNLRDNFNCLKEILKSVPPKEVRDLNLEASFEGLLQSAPIVKSLSLQSKNLEIHTLKLLAQNYKTLSDELPAIYAYLLSSGFDESYIQSIFDLSGGINLFHLIKAALKVFEGSEHIVKENLLTKDVAQLVLLSRYLARITIPFSDRNNELIKNIIKLLPFIHTEGSVISGLINFLTGLSESKVDKIITSLAIILSDKEIDFDTLPLMKVITQFENSSDELIEALLILKDMTSYQLARFIQAADLVSTLITKHTLVAFLRGFIGCDSPGLTIDDVIATIFQSNLELTQDIRSHIVRALETSPDRNYISSLVFQARRYITFAPDNIDWALLQAAESYVEPSSQANLHNPYRIYFRHLALKDAPLISPVSSFVEECESFSGSICQGNLFDRMTHVPRSSIETMTGGHIMSYTELLAMLTDLEGRLFTRPDADLEVLLKPASEGGHGILDFIQEELLSQDAAYPRVAMLRQLITNLKHPFFKETLDATNQEMVSLPSAYLQAILHFISSQDQGVPPGRIISDSDVLLLRISSSMLYCNAGKSEGLFVAYKTFVSKESEGRYVIGTQKDVVSEEENKVKGYVHDFVIDRILQELSNPAHLMRKLSGRSASGFIAQPSHEAIYIKNMLGPILGLPHEIAFDFYTSTVSADLISKTREELLSLFYLHFSLRNLSEALAQNFNSLDVKVKNAYFSLINEKAPYEMLEKIWELDDEGNFSLRLKGAFYLLSLFGIVDLASEVASSSEE